MIFKSVVDRNPCHPNIHTRFQRIAFGIEPQNRGMLRDSVAKQNDINVVVKVLFLLPRWFLPLQFAGRIYFAGINKVCALLCRAGAAISSLLQFEGNCCQRRQVNDDRMVAAHPLASFAVDAPEVSYVAAAVRFAVGIEKLAIEAGFRHA